ncbi:hypothetical protein [Desulfurobacterium indicum]|uniref:ResB-like domain-containing protein n=1 Tax=Desulfurobacterium indicum TaxID=1914305 RepID=A0A1R1ML60_9BACT|nr:hypothetical protein [Desulfurobacterium indicum]OMH40440.1 hypothetical protein BLW93_05095 [Desulfurobacterium indicum]
MVFKLIKSIRVFLFLLLCFFVSSFVIIFTSKGTINEMGLYRLIPLMPLYLKIPIIITSLLLLLTGIQTLLCSISSFKPVSLKNLLHITGGATIVLIVLFLFIPVYQFRGFPGRTVKGKNISIKIEKVNINPQTMSASAKVSIEKNEQVDSGSTAFNSPLITKNGVVWISGMDSNGMIFKYQPFSLIPFVTLLSAVSFIILLSIETVKTFIKK